MQIFIELLDDIFCFLWVEYLHVINKLDMKKSNPQSFSIVHFLRKWFLAYACFNCHLDVYIKLYTRDVIQLNIINFKHVNHNSYFDCLPERQQGLQYY